MEENQILVLRDNAKNQLLQIKNVESGIDYLNKLKAIEVWVKAEKKDAELQNIVAEQKIRTQRVLGELITNGQKNGAIRKESQSFGNSSDTIVVSELPSKLSDIGITPKQSSTFKAIATIPEEIFEKEIYERKQGVENAVNELTTAGMLRLTKNVHVSNNSGENKWYTPQHIIEKAKSFLGTIDLDPASSTLANEIVNANIFYTEQDNGLAKEWFGNVWLNPPYAQPLISEFSKAIIEKRKEYNQLLLLVNNATETAWLQNILEISSCICLIKSRVKFIDKSGMATGSPLQGQVIVYIGSNIKNFNTHFHDLGVCMKLLKEEV